MSTKKYPLLLLLFCLALVQTACDKEKQKPEVAIISHKVQEDGSVNITGAIVNGKTKKLSSTGFLVGTDDSFLELSGYVGSGSSGTEFYASVNGDKFTTVIPSEYFQSYTKYYFRPYAITESNQVSYGPIISIDNITGPAVTPTCNLTPGYVNTTALGMPQNYYQVTISPDSWSEVYTITAETSNNYRFYYKFYKKPKTGLYKTISYQPSVAGKVMIYYSTPGSFNSYNILEGASVYVNETEKDKWDISICDATWKLTSSTLPFSTRVICPL